MIDVITMWHFHQWPKLTARRILERRHLCLVPVLSLLPFQTSLVGLRYRFFSPTGTHFCHAQGIRLPSPTHRHLAGTRSSLGDVLIGLCRLGRHLGKIPPAGDSHLLLRLWYVQNRGWLREDVRLAKVCRPALGCNLLQASRQGANRDAQRAAALASSFARRAGQQLSI
jgi:hypothetical protein